MGDRKESKTQRMVKMAILIAIMLIFNFTPLGYLKAGPIEITFMCIPVAVGAMVLGPECGAVLGAVFGLTSFLQCLGTSAFGVLMFGLSPVAAFLICVVPRVLCGWLPALLFRFLRGKTRNGYLPHLAGGLATALLNTVLFTASVLLFFWNSAEFLQTLASWGIPIGSVWLFIGGFVGLNGIVEAIACCIISAAITKVLLRTER